MMAGAGGALIAYCEFVRDTARPSSPAWPAGPLRTSSHRERLRAEWQQTGELLLLPACSAGLRGSSKECLGRGLCGSYSMLGGGEEERGPGSLVGPEARAKRSAVLADSRRNIYDD